MTYKLNGKKISREKLMNKVGKNYLEYQEFVAKNLFQMGCYEYVDDIRGKLSVSIVK